MDYAIYFAGLADEAAAKGDEVSAAYYRFRAATDKSRSRKAVHRVTYIKGVSEAERSNLMAAVRRHRDDRLDNAITSAMGWYVGD